MQIFLDTFFDFWFSQFYILIVLYTENIKDKLVRRAFGAPL